jgi:hypothetical protein
MADKGKEIDIQDAGNPKSVDVFKITGRHGVVVSPKRKKKDK